MRVKPILYVLHEDENYVEGRFHNGETFFIDLEDFEKVSNYFWSLSKGYAIKSENKQPMHRFVLGLGKADRYKIEVDHINRNRLDNRKSNLRIVSRQDNMYNKSKYKNNKSRRYQCSRTNIRFKKKIKNGKKNQKNSIII